VVNLAIQRKST